MLLLMIVCYAEEGLSHAGNLICCKKKLKIAVLFYAVLWLWAQRVYSKSRIIRNTPLHPRTPTS
jgi:hypothetical protein